MAPFLAILVAIVAGFPLGIVYAYLIKWIPFIYLNFLVTLGYGFLLGFLTLQMLKFGKVRNAAVALVTGIVAGVVGLYFSWNGHVHSLAAEIPWLLTPTQIGRAIEILYQEGSWGIGFGSQEPLTGIPLAIVWAGEAAIIVGLTALISFRGIRETPFCETHECWLDEKKVIDKLDAFTNPAQLEAFRNGDISPLDEARPRVPASGVFSRLTLKHSRNCHDYCTLSIANVSVTMDKSGKPKEKVEPLMTHLLVPKSMFEYLEKFDHATARPQPAGT
ncbi:MAG TPA: hypothetical protein VFV81_06790 [Verrucomicrobiae bacterium]|nr:hypothetical protein [Verrucomicrobiae bacterium]